MGDLKSTHKAIDLTASAIFGNNRNNIKNSASNVNELLIYPIETPAASGTQSELIEEATKTIQIAISTFEKINARRDRERSELLLRDLKAN